MKCFISAVVLAVSLMVLAPAKAEAASGRCKAYEGMLAKYHLPVATFSKIMYRESRCRPTAVNRSSGARGLLQIMPAHAGKWRNCVGHNLLTAQGNISCAAKLYKKSGTGPWRQTR